LAKRCVQLAQTPRADAFFGIRRIEAVKNLVLAAPTTDACWLCLFPASRTDPFLLVSWIAIAKPLDFLTAGANPWVSQFHPARLANTFALIAGIAITKPRFCRATIAAGTGIKALPTVVTNAGARLQWMNHGQRFFDTSLIRWAGWARCYWCD
jgi:hypothetical protein